MKHFVACCGGPPQPEVNRCGHEHCQKGQPECRCMRCLVDANIDIHWMVVCMECGNKRCPHATDHRNECTNSNELGQPGSTFALLSRRDESVPLPEEPNPDAEFASGMCNNRSICDSCPSHFLCYMKAKAEHEIIAARTSPPDSTQ